MEIEAPSHAIAIWSEGESLMIRLPDRQLITIPQALGPLLAILRAREEAANKRIRQTVGTASAPVQYDIDKIAQAVNGKDIATWEKKLREDGLAIRAKEEKRKAKEKEKLIKRAVKRQASKDAEDFFKSIGL